MSTSTSSIAFDSQNTGALLASYQRVRQHSLDLCAPLEVEDYLLQPMADVSPIKWHLAHTSWFFETFVLKPILPNYQCYQDSFDHLFNSYYNQIGQPWPRVKRGDLSRPTVRDVLNYRAYIDEQMQPLLRQDASDHEPLIALGLHHEQQHQELILTDLKYSFGINPLAPIYRKVDQSASVASPCGWIQFAGGLVEAGSHKPDKMGVDCFAFDNETPKHKVHLEPYALASRLVTNGEFLDFIQDGGYQKAKFWLSEGWERVTAENWRHPLYWREKSKGTKQAGIFCEYHLSGESNLDLEAPVCHVSLYEADAYARWKNARLPTEVEWEQAAKVADITPTATGEAQALKPAVACQPQPSLQQMFGELWQWTASSYAPYPGFKPFAGNIGEYNGKFMCAQHVLRGSSFATPSGHARQTYRNFFYPQDRWQFTGIRLATNIR